MDSKPISEVVSEISKDAEATVQEFRNHLQRVFRLKGEAQTLNCLIGIYEKRLDKLLEDQERLKPLLDELAQIQQQLEPHIKYVGTLLRTHRQLHFRLVEEQKDNEAHADRLKQTKMERVLAMEDAKENHFKNTKQWPELEEEALRLAQELSTMKITHENLLDRQRLVSIRDLTEVRAAVLKSTEQVEHLKTQKAALNTKVASLLEMNKMNRLPTPVKPEVQKRTTMAPARTPEQDKAPVQTAHHAASVAFKSPGPTFPTSVRANDRQTSPGQFMKYPAISRPSVSNKQLEDEKKQPMVICLKRETSTKSDADVAKEPTARLRPKKNEGRNLSAFEPSKKLTVRMSPLSFKEPFGHQSAGVSAEAGADSADISEEEKSSKRPRVTRTLMSRTYKTMGPQKF